MLRDIEIAPSPHIHEALSTRKVMLDVIIGLLPAMIAAGYFFRKYALILIPVCIISCMATELICNVLAKKENPGASLGDLSAVVTGIILALSVPPTLPIWAAVIGSAFAIAIGKMVFGGLGGNIFNPAMVGRAFLTASFGMMMTTWTVPADINTQMPTISPENESVNAMTQATPLGHSKTAIKTDQGSQLVNHNIKAAFWGNIGGCLGETSSFALIIGGLYLLLRKTINIHIPLAVLLSSFTFASIAWLIDPEAYISPIAHLMTGGLLIGAFFIATDPVTAPLTKRGMWFFGIGIGAITMLIRIVGEYPEGVMYSVLLMNAVTPLIDRLFKRVPAGGKPHENE